MKTINKAISGLLLFQIVNAKSTTTGQDYICPDYTFDTEDAVFVSGNGTLLSQLVEYTESVLANFTYANFPDSTFGMPGVTITVQTEDGIYNSAYGYSDADLQVEMKANALVEVGSNTKMFIGTLLLKAHEEGLVNLEKDTLGEYLPEIGKKFYKGNELTLIQLARHNAGLADYGDIVIADGLKSRELMLQDYSPEELLDKVASVDKNSSIFTPGNCSKFVYSNTGWVILGMILEKVHNKSITEILQSQIFDPLEMINTTFGEGLPTSEDLNSHGYYRVEVESSGGTQLLDTSRWNLNQGWAAGAIISTGSDMVKFAKELSSNGKNHKLFKRGEKGFRDMVEKFGFSNAEMGRYGFSRYGLGIGNAGHKHLYAHGGQTLGFLSTFTFSTNPIFQVFLATNNAVALNMIQATDYYKFMNPAN